jgi:hypothetical protein
LKAIHLPITENNPVPKQIDSPTDKEVFEHLDSQQFHFNNQVIEKQEKGDKNDRQQTIWAAPILTGSGNSRL